jgi:hypothetical protein
LDQGTLRAAIPLIILAVVFALRWRNLKKPRQLKVNQLWIAPALITVVVVGVLFAMPPAAMGWLAFMIGVPLGAAVGWQRARLMHIERDAASGDLMMRQTPAALLLLFGIAGLRRLFGVAGGGGDSAGGTLAPTALLFTDGLLGFALGMVIAQRLTLYLRAKEH